MSLLTVCQEILYETKNTNVPSTIIGNTSDVARQILQAVNIATVNLVRSYNWQELQKETTFVTTPTVQNYDLPTDYDRIVNNTIWNKTTKYQVIGAVSGQEWRILTDSNLAVSTNNDYFRIRQKQISIYPVPTATETFVYEYISKNSILGTGDVEQNEWLADSDTFLIDEYLLKLNATWRFLSMLGRPYAEKQREFDNAIEERFARNGGREVVIYPNVIRGYLDRDYGILNKPF